jgi:hypothetical protein
MNSIPLEQIEQFINTKKYLLMEFLTKTGDNLDYYAQQYRLILMEQRQVTRSKLVQSNHSSDSTDVPK